MPEVAKRLIRKQHNKWKKLESKGMLKYMIHYSVKGDSSRVINSDLQQATVIEAKSEEEAKNKLYEIELRKINYISSVKLFKWE